jgi:hypothetical protein
MIVLVTMLGQVIMVVPVADDHVDAGDHDGACNHVDEGDHINTNED